MRALVLAAGWATRLGDLASDRPKPLLPVAGTTPLDLVVDRLDAVAEVGRIDVWTHERGAPAFRSWARERRTRARLGVSSNGTRCLEERLGAVGDLQRFLDLHAPDEPLLVVGGDQLFDGSLAELARHARRDPVLAIHDVGSRELVRRYASVELEADGHVRRLVEKDPEPASTLAVTAIYGLPVDALPEVGRHLAAGGRRDNLGHLAEWLVAHRRVRGVRLAGRWIDVGSPDELARGRRAFARAPGTPAR